MVFFTHTHYLKKVERAINLKVHFSTPDFWLKLITSASVFLTPIKETIIAVICLVVVDAITGIWASYKRGQKFSSRKFSMTLAKLIWYTIAIAVCHMVQIYLVPQIPFVKVMVYFVVFYEFSSFLENVGIITGRDVFSWFRGFFDKIKPGGGSFPPSDDKNLPKNGQPRPDDNKKGN